jgi:hypothetical protein
VRSCGKRSIQHCGRHSSSKWRYWDFARRDFHWPDRDPQIQEEAIIQMADRSARSAGGHEDAMLFKAVGLRPHGWLNRLLAKAGYRFLQWRKKNLAKLNA